MDHHAGRRKRPSDYNCNRACGRPAGRERTPSENNDSQPPLAPVRASGGRAVAGRESRIADWMRRASSAEGLSICPETAVAFDVLQSLRQTGDIRPDDEVVVFNTGAAQKYLEAFPFELPRIDRAKPIEQQIGDYRLTCPTAPA